MSDDYRDKNDKKNWAEIDHTRIRGTKTDKTVSQSEIRAQKSASTQAKKDLNALFSGSKVSKEKAERLAEIQASRGKPAYSEKLSAYYSEYGLPLEWEAQLLFLDHRDSKLVIEILEQMKKSAPREELSKQGLLKAKLKVMALSTFDSKLLDKIREVEESILAR